MSAISRVANTLISRLRWAQRRRADASRFLQIFQRDVGEVESVIGPIAGKRVLEIGCGLNYPHVVVFNSLGCDVTGIDLEVVPPKSGMRGYFCFARQKGRRPALRAFLCHYIIDRAIHAGIRSKLNFGGRSELDVRVMDASSTDFETDTFDLIYSCAVLEHVSDLPGVLAETKRILKPGGLAVFGIHLFASRSGGHNLESRDRATGRPVVPPPWDHLRENRYPTELYLNKLRELDFREAFEKQAFLIVDWRRNPSQPEDVELLTPEIELELSATGYGHEELLTDGITAYVRKPD